MFGWIDFEADESGDVTDDGREKLILTIGHLDEHGFVDDEVAVIVHRMSNKLDNDALMDQKRADAQMIVDALNY